MFNKIKRTLQNESGLSIIFVLCIGALFIAMTTAVLYGASSLEASANQVISQEDAYIMARSFADTVEQQLTDTSSTPGDLKTFVLTKFFGTTYFDNEDYTFTYNADSAAPEKPKITLVLHKEKMDGQETADGTKTGVPVAASKNPADYAETIQVSDYYDGSGVLQTASLQSTLYTFNQGGCDYRLTVTVKVETGGKSFTLMREYERYPVLQAYYRSSGQLYTYRGAGVVLTQDGTATTISLSDSEYSSTTFNAFYCYKNGTTDIGATFKRIGGEDDA